MTYEEFIENILNTRGRFISDKTVIKERHHIKMKSLGGTNEESNLIDLIGAEHYEAHKLLALENPDCKEAQNAWWMMSHNADANGREYEVSAEDWERSRKAFIETNSGKNSPWYGKKHTEETKEKLRKANTGRKASDEAKAKMSKARKGRKPTKKSRELTAQKLKGRPFTEEHKQALKDAHADFTKEKHPKWGTHLTKETKVKIGKANGRKVECEGMIFYSIPECAKYYDVNYNTMKNWLYGKYEMPKIWVDRGLKFYDSNTIN